MFCYSLPTPQKYRLWSILTVSIFIPMSAINAAPPVQYGAWTVNNGVIDAPCPAEALSCEDPILDEGFMVRKITMPAVYVAGFEQSGPKSYFQYIMTDAGASGDPNNQPFEDGGLRFANETLSKASSAQHGSSYQKVTIAESTMDANNLEDRWFQTSTAETGFRNGPVNVTLDLGMNIEFDQQVRQIDWSDPFNPVETLNSTIKGNGNTGGGGTINFDLIITQDVALDPGVQKFQWLKDNRTGNHIAGSGTPILPGGSNGGDFTTSGIGGVTNRMTATWIGQLVDDVALELSPFSFTSYKYNGTYYVNPPTLSSIFSTTELLSFTSANPPTNLNTYFSPNSTANFWDATQDVYAAPAPITPTAWSNVAADYVTARNDHVANPLSGTGGGGPPLDLSSWTVANGVISADPCGLALTCGTAMVDNGFYQREIIDGNGDRYFQTIITEANATGDPNVAPVYTTGGNAGSFNPGTMRYANESIISPTRGNGLSSRTQFAQGTEIWSEAQTGITYYPFVPARTTITPMAYSTTLNTGWAEGIGATPVMEVRQILGFDGSGANLGAALPGEASFLGRRLGQEFNLTMASNGAKDYSMATVSYDAPRPQLQYMRQIEGGIQTTSHDATIDPFLIDGGTNGGNITWAAGDTISASYGWSNYSVYAPGAPRVNIGIVSYTNLTTGERTSLGSIDMGVPTLIDPFADPAPPVWTGSGVNQVTWAGQDPTW